MPTCVISVRAGWHTDTEFGDEVVTGSTVQTLVGQTTQARGTRRMARLAPGLTAVKRARVARALARAVGGGGGGADMHMWTIQWVVMPYMPPVGKPFDWFFGVVMDLMDTNDRVWLPCAVLGVAHKADWGVSGHFLRNLEILSSQRNLITLIKALLPVR